MSSELKNKTALITGASSGIGRAVAGELAARGATVLLVARRQEPLGQAAEEIVRSGGIALPIAADISRTAEIDRCLAICRGKTGRLDIAVVNAGRGLAGGLLTSDESKWDELYELNVLGAARLMRRCAQWMVEQKAGDIVVLGSVSGHNISPFSGFYGSTKWALASIAEALRRELAPKRIRVSTVKPGVVESEFQAVAGYDRENFYDTIAKFGSLLQPQDVADAIAYIVTRPPHILVSELVVRPAGQDYP
ncbi:MAG: SDR family NAD(P)-dependent oxidoreductase [Phycisphaerae bacterium]